MKRSTTIPTLLAVGMAATLSACMAALGPGPNVNTVPILVLDFAPRHPGHRGPTVREGKGWTEPRVLADSLKAAAWELSLRRVLYDYVDWRTLDAFPPMASGQTYDTERYEQCLSDGVGCIDGPADIAAILERYGAAPLVDRGVVREVWILGGPHMGLEGAYMAGPGARPIDEAFPEVAASEPFPVLGIRYDHGSGDALASWCRRVSVPMEAALRELPGGADAWERFTATIEDGEPVGMGTCRQPPNASEPGVYDHPDTVTSTSPSWLAYPFTAGGTLEVSAATWNGPDYKRNFLRWWIFHVPHSDRPSETDVPSDWWPLAF